MAERPQKQTIAYKIIYYLVLQLIGILMLCRRRKSWCNGGGPALFNEINHGLGIQWNVTAASNYRWRGHEKYIRVLLAIMALCLKAVGATTSMMKRWASDGAIDAAMV